MYGSGVFFFAYEEAVDAVKGLAAISFLVLNSLINHSISAFAAMFVFAAKMQKMEKRNIPWVIGILFAFMTFALIMAYAFNKNFMFFFSGDGTPFDLFLQLYQGALIPYQITIYVLQCGYMGIFYLAYYGVVNAIEKHRAANPKQA